MPCADVGVSTWRVVPGGFGFWSVAERAIELFLIVLIKLPAPATRPQRVELHSKTESRRECRWSYSRVTSHEDAQETKDFKVSYARRDHMSTTYDHLVDTVTALEI